MTQIATVEKLLPGGYAEISVPRKTACGHDCEECAGCGMTGAAIRARAKNDPGAAVGQKVVVESSTKSCWAWSLWYTCCRWSASCWATSCRRA